MCSYFSECLLMRKCFPEFAVHSFLDYLSANVVFIIEMLCAVWSHLYNLKNVEIIHGEVLLLVTLLHGCF